MPDADTNPPTPSEGHRKLRLWLNQRYGASTHARHRLPKPDYHSLTSALGVVNEKLVAAGLPDSQVAYYTSLRAWMDDSSAPRTPPAEVRLVLEDLSGGLVTRADWPAPLVEAPGLLGSA